MSNTPIENIEAATSIAQFVGGVIGRYYGKVVRDAAATFLLGQPAWAASTVDLVTKLENGTATGMDVAEVLDMSASTLAAFGVLAGLTATIWLEVTGVVGIGAAI